jgi:hypothetical protein
MQKTINVIYAYLFYFYATTANIPMGVMPQIYCMGLSISMNAMHDIFIFFSMIALK